MAHEQSLRDLLEERQLRSETIYQAVRYYLAERLHDPDPDELLAQLATVMDDPDDACATLSKDALLLENAALLVLSQAWEDPAERERVRRAIDGATGMLPIIDPDLIAIVCLYGVYRLLLVERHEKTTIRRPDGSLKERLVVEYGPLAALLRMFGNRAAAPVPLTRPSEASRSIVLVDIQGSARVNGSQQAQRRDWLLSSMREAVGRLRLRWEDLDPDHWSDGVRLLVPDDGATLVDLVNGLPAHLEGPLREHARMSGGLTRLKVRMTIHAGLPRNSTDGEDGVAHAACLIDAPAAKQLLERADAGLALILSEWVFEQVVRSGYGRVKEHEYQQITVVVEETTTTAWVHLS